MDLLRLARLDAGQETLDMVSCEVRSLVHGVLADLSPMSDARHQRIERPLPDADTERRPGKLHRVAKPVLTPSRMP